MLTMVQKIAAIRHNNPGDVSLPIQGWHGGGKIVGAQGQPGYGDFPTMAIGFEAFKQRLRTYIARGWDTIALMAPHYATDPNWRNGVARYSSLGLNERLDATNGDQMGELAAGIIRQETGHTLDYFGLSIKD